MTHRFVDELLARLHEGDPVVASCARCGWTAAEPLRVAEARNEFAAHRCLEPPPPRPLARRSSR